MVVRQVLLKVLATYLLLMAPLTLQRPELDTTEDTSSVDFRFNLVQKESIPICKFQIA